jgi:transcriptional regulator with XRE-family HTH domain
MITVMNIANVFGSFLKETRKGKKITQEQLALSLNVSTVYVHQLETAKVDAPDKSKCTIIAKTLGLDADFVWNKAKEQKLLRFLNKENIVHNLF